MKVKNYRESIKEGSISFNASSPFLEWVYGLKAKRIIRKIRKSKRLPKATKITYTVVVNYKFKIGEESFDERQRNAKR